MYVIGLLCIKALARQVEPCTQVLFQLENMVTITKTCKKAFPCNRNVKIQLQWVLHRCGGPKCLEFRHWHSHQYCLVLKNPRKMKIVSVPYLYQYVSQYQYLITRWDPCIQLGKVLNTQISIPNYSPIQGFCFCLKTAKHLWCNSMGRNVCTAPRYQEDLGSKGRKVPGADTMICDLRSVATSW